MHRSPPPSPQRRALCLLCALLPRAAAGAAAALAGAGLAGCAAAPGAAGPPRLAPKALAPGVFLLAGSRGAADADNLGRIGNSGFIVGPEGVIAVDTGTSFAHGEAMLAAIASVTDRPVRLALVTHTRPEFLFGGGAFRARGIPVQMHLRCARLMAARCETCLKALRQSVGEAALQGTAMYVPDGSFEASHTLSLIGRPVQVGYHGHSSGPGDISVFDPTSRVLFAGGLLDAGRVPDIQDSDLRGWHRALAELRALAPAIVVPGHGPAGPAGLIDQVGRYLLALEDRVRRLLADGASLLSVAEDAELPDYEGWDQYDAIHRRNASIAFLRVEREQLLKP